MSLSTATPADPQAVDDLHQLSALQLSGLYRSREVSPVEVVQSVLAHIEENEPRLNAFALLDGNAALAAARESAQRWQANAPLSDLDGVPAAVKDNLWVKGWPTLYGSRATSPQDRNWDEDCAAAARLREGGVVLLGKTTTSEFASATLGDSPLNGVTRSPWNTRHSPGGSSGGSAAAAAIGFGPLHVATDGGGSTRVPSSYSGLFGFKPSYGRVPSYPSSHTAATFHVTPMTRTVRDSALLLGLIAQPDRRDFNARQSEPGDWLKDLEQGVKGLRIAYSPALGYVDVDPEVAERVKQALVVFETLGAVVEHAEPGFENPLPIFKALTASAVAHLFTRIPPERHALAGVDLQNTAEFGRSLSAVDYLKAVEAREALARHLADFHQTWDLLITPATPITAPLADYPPGDAGPRTLSPFAYPFNLSRQPAASIPIGLSSKGLPIGLQVVGRPLRDDLVLRAARAYEILHPFVHTARVL